ncbi:ABC transporter substrate-binding protein [Novispirillum itersonii]|uniref:Iron complex transport system substrate-binding protein n=1 Tax=Novispirillum itersonii TaxID=189 RepID=A0A7W9ZGL0_NOVIT|nr:ABC transporter substrate-binding protein [Novispirillum itersonii]MBB6211118.1 iron complex transport system substrate-binding protein [Novispirillum itersonii]
MNGFLRRARALLCVAGLVLPAAATAAPISVTDMLDRSVTLPAPAKRVVLAEGRHILTLALLDRQPLSLVAAWGNDLRRFSPETYAALGSAFPEVDAIPDVGGLGNGSFSMEAVIKARPDLVLFTLYGPPPEGIRKLDEAGIPYVFVDFFRDPLTKTVPSLRLLGRVLDREAQAEEFISFYESHMAGVAGRLKTVSRRPDVLFHLNPDGKDCCYSSGPGNMTDFIAAAGGRNIGADVIPGSIGKLGLEYVLSRNPDFYLAGGGSSVTLTGVQIGPGVSADQAGATLRSVLEAPGIRGLKAVQEGRAGGVWLFFFDNPLFVVGIEGIAKMLHPAAFRDLDPDRTLAELNERFLPFPLRGTFWTGTGGQP